MLPLLHGILLLKRKHRTRIPYIHLRIILQDRNQFHEEPLIEMIKEHKTGKLEPPLLSLKRVLPLIVFPRGNKMFEEP